MNALMGVGGGVSGAEASSISDECGEGRMRGMWDVGCGMWDVGMGGIDDGNGNVDQDDRMASFIENVK